MCGIAGLVNMRPGPPPTRAAGAAMLAALRHRGPDGDGLYADGHAVLGNARLSIVDLAGGGQPICNEDGSVWIVFNGEIFNHVDLRRALQARGHHLRTRCDTEVIIHLYEEHGPACVHFLNGQFAIAIWEPGPRRLFLARDRLGVRPLYYTQNEGRLLFASEVKALFTQPGVPRQIDPTALAEAFSLWSIQAPRTIFNGIHQLPPGHWFVLEAGGSTQQRYWDLPHGSHAASEAEQLDQLDALLNDAVRLRLQADVPVGAYLSGGLDSSLITAIARRHAPHLETFSIAFDDPAYDERAEQTEVAGWLGTRHHVVEATFASIAEVLADVVASTETPLLRTAPAPMWLLAREVHAHGLKVVLSGEGADELFGGYDLFKEHALRRFWARRPGSQLRPALLARLYPEIGGLHGAGQAYRTEFFRKSLTECGSPYFSHTLRWANSARLRQTLLRHPDGPALPALPPDFARRSPLAQAQYLETTTFLSPYLLAVQGDRVAMAHSVEARYPFLDPRMVELASGLPDDRKLLGFSDKRLLRRLAARYLPAPVAQRRKRPYRAPIQRALFNGRGAELVAEALSPEALDASNLFHPAPVLQLARKAAGPARLSEVEEMMLIGVLSTQLLFQQVCAGHGLTARPRVPTHPSTP